MKVKVSLPTDDATYDEVLRAFVEEADALIDAVLQASGMSAPLADPPLRIRKLSSTIAALLFLAWRSPRREDVASYLRVVREELEMLAEDLRSRGEVLLTGE
ncbi:MAG: hypothetical protein RMJ75_00355 [Nitrososphaerota archaeon]|nr:hypothetical protein [Nitrososphaerota archaeon]